MIMGDEHGGAGVEDMADCPGGNCSRLRKVVVGALGPITDVTVIRFRLAPLA